MIDIFLNKGRTGIAGIAEADSAMLGSGGELAPHAYLAQCPIHRPTALLSLPALAASMGIKSLHVKDEGSRLRLNSFKALGGAYAVFQLVHAAANQALGRQVATSELLDDTVRSVASTMTFVCATDGNHGRSLAAGAKLLAARAVVLVHEGVSVTRIDAIRAQGAEIVVCNGDYDDSVAQARDMAASNGWTLISDTSWPEYQAIPRTVMQGYLVAGAEAWNQLADIEVRPTHILLQAGVGGFAAAIALHAVTTWQDMPPTIIVVEPDRAACLLASAIAGHSVKVAHDQATEMAMLECFEPSMIAFNILHALADAFVAFDDSYCARAMRCFAHPLAADPKIIAGESGAAGLSALIAVGDTPGAAQSLGLGPTSHVLLFNTEGATDRENYDRLLSIGREGS